MLRYGHMVHESLVARARACRIAREKRLAKIRTRADAQRYTDSVRKAVRKCFPALPARTPLKARVTRTIEADGYCIEMLHYQSRPQVHVTANLYRPLGLDKKAPCVLGLSGHSKTGKAEPAYQAYAQALVRQGFVVLLIDPVSQGERRQFYPQDGGKRPGLCDAHNLMGNAQRLVDDFFGSWRVWDAMRGLDYLLTRPEVDSARVGVTGNSGGGTLTTFLSALDSRITMCAPSCHVGSYVTDLENELPRDAEQNPPGLLARGLDTADFLLCHPPRPTLILSQQYDFFDERAARQAYNDVRSVYRKLGAAKNVEYFVGAYNHGYHPDAREAMVRFFCKHAGVRYRKNTSACTVRAPRELQVAPRGEVRSLDSKPVFAFTRERAEALAKVRRPLSVNELAKQARSMLRMPKVSTPVTYRLCSHSGAFAGEWQRHQFALETEPGIQVLLSQWGRENRLPRGRVTLCLGHAEVLEEIKSVPALRCLEKSAPGFITLDPRGMGETRALTCGDTDFFCAYGCDYLYAATHDLLGESYLGRRVFDVLRTLDCLKRNGATEIHLVGRGLGSIAAAFSALLHSSVTQVTLLQYLPSYQMIACAPRSAWPFSCLLPGVLRRFDLPDVYAALGKRLTLKGAWNTQMKPLRGKE